MLPKFLSFSLIFLSASAVRQVDSGAVDTLGEIANLEERQTGSSFSFSQGGNTATFQYSTNSPHAENWIGIYQQNGGPVNKVQVEQSLAWGYTTGPSGTVRINAGSLSTGRYRAFFLARGGYRWLASLIYINIGGGSSFSLDTSRARFTFNYSAADAHAENWIGIYNANGGPVNQVKPEAALAWAYTPSSSGSVHIPQGSLGLGRYRAFFLSRGGYTWVANPIYVDISGSSSSSFSWNRNRSLPVKVEAALKWAYTSSESASVTISASGLAGGTYRAFFLARDGYQWLASPITVSVSGISFTRKTATLRNAKVGVAYSASFTKVSGAGWVSVSSSGVLAGTPTSAGSSTVTVRALGNSATDDVIVTIPVRTSGDCLVQNVRVMSYNMWSGGSNMNNYHQKQLRALIDANVDIVGLQEANPTRARALGNSLGWHYWESAGNGRTSILSRYPIAATYSHVGVSVAARIALDGSRQQINVWNAHLTAYPYGPYEACHERKSAQQILASEASSGRTGQITAIVNAIRPQIAASSNVSVLLLGDFNAPSHQDWTPALQSKNCGYANIQWPTSRIPIR